jgi:hypothetical protein
MGEMNSLVNAIAISEDFKLYLTLFTSIIAILISIGTSYIAFRKYQPEIKNTNAETDKINAETNKIAAETVAAYALELKTIKEDNKREREAMEKELETMRIEINKLRKEINDINNNQEKERSMYRQFINELLMGINRLTGQIQMRGETPVWSPGKPPFDI